MLVVVILGGISSALGPRVVFVVAPIVAIVLVLMLIRYSYRVGSGESISPREALENLISDVEIVEGEAPFEVDEIVPENA